MTIALVSAGAATNTYTPSFGTSTTAGNLLIGWAVGNNGTNTNPWSVTGTGWLLAIAGGGAFEWTAIFYKPDCGSGESPPTFACTGATVNGSMLAEFSGAATSSPLNQTGNGGTGGSTTQAASCSAADTTANCLITFAAYWNGSNTGGSVGSQAMTDSAGSSVTPTSYDGLISGTTSEYYNFGWGIAGATLGASGDAASATLSVFSGGGCGIATFAPQVAAGPVVQPAFWTTMRTV